MKGAKEVFYHGLSDNTNVLDRLNVISHFDGGDKGVIEKGMKMNDLNVEQLKMNDLNVEQLKVNDLNVEQLKVREEIIELLSEIVVKDISKITGETRCQEDLGIDSLQIITLILNVESKFNIDVDFESFDISDIYSINTLVDFVIREKKQNA